MESLAEHLQDRCEAVSHHARAKSKTAAAAAGLLLGCCCCCSIKGGGHLAQTLLLCRRRSSADLGNLMKMRIQETASQPDRSLFSISIGDIRCCCEHNAEHTKREMPPIRNRLRPSISMVARVRHACACKLRVRVPTAVCTGEKPKAHDCSAMPGGVPCRRTWRPGRSPC